LPIIRTSVDHGTAYDIVSKNRADPGSMKEAIRLAIDLSGRQRPPKNSLDNSSPPTEQYLK
ncbi:MAG: hypothetical protein B6D36_12335, partial [Planctomycetes bacterium UTPLA1]